MQIEVLRLNHRIGRDVRISTHVALTSRAFGASKIYYSGDKDSNMENSVNKLTENFGGVFEIEHISNSIELIKEKIKQGFLIVHLTIYGLQIQKIIKNIRKHTKVLVIVGGEKVEPRFYKLSNYNVSVTNQPHSEVSAVCFFLDYCFNRSELNKVFRNSKIKIIGTTKGKIVKH